MQILTFHFQKYLTKAKVPEQGATASLVIYPMLLSSFFSQFSPRTHKRSQGRFDIWINTCPNICCMSLVYFFYFLLKYKVLEWYIHTLLISVQLLGFFSSVHIINNFLSALVFCQPNFPKLCWLGAATGLSTGSYSSSTQRSDNIKYNSDLVLWKKWRNHWKMIRFSENRSEEFRNQYLVE